MQYLVPPLGFPRAPKRTTYSGKVRRFTVQTISFRIEIRNRREEGKDPQRDFELGPRRELL